MIFPPPVVPLPEKVHFGSGGMRHAIHVNFSIFIIIILFDWDCKALKYPILHVANRDTCNAPLFLRVPLTSNILFVLLICKWEAVNVRKNSCHQNAVWGQIAHFSMWWNLSGILEIGQQQSIIVARAHNAPALRCICICMNCVWVAKWTPAGQTVCPTPWRVECCWRIKFSLDE